MTYGTVCRLWEEEKIIGEGLMGKSTELWMCALRAFRPLSCFCQT
jgi:hypothetical protein